MTIDLCLQRNVPTYGENVMEIDDQVQVYDSSNKKWEASSFETPLPPPLSLRPYIRKKPCSLKEPQLWALFLPNPTPILVGDCVSFIQCFSDFC